MYDQREKAQRDYEWALSGAREEGREVGHQEGREVGREEGREVGKLIGQIQLLQQLLGDENTADAELQSLSHDALMTKLVELQQRIRDRPL
ncbi:MAG: hypothetical protein KDB22_07665 [Planctomycetales bacterium]|nr:hypothetical protein [Planctomycetales bacterium]